MARQIVGSPILFLQPKSFSLSKARIGYNGLTFNEKTSRNGARNMQFNQLQPLAVTTAFLLSGLFAGCSGGAPASTAKTEAGSAQSVGNDSAGKAGVTREDVERLVAQLRSKNKPLNPAGGRLVPKPENRKGYDKQAQQHVALAEHKLAALGKDAFPVLIEHLNDKEYSLSFATSLLRDFSVGEVCFMLIESQVHLTGTGYQTRDGADGKSYTYPRYFSQYCGNVWFTQDGVRNWWSEHEHQSLREMQIDALEWAIAEEQKIGFRDDRDRERFLNPLLGMLDTLKNNEPLIAPK